MLVNIEIGPTFQVFEPLCLLPISMTQSANGIRKSFLGLGRLIVLMAVPYVGLWLAAELQFAHF
jgi:hypothetical protein